MTDLLKNNWLLLAMAIGFGFTAIMAWQSALHQRNARACNQRMMAGVLFMAVAALFTAGIGRA